MNYLAPRTSCTASRRPGFHTGLVAFAAATALITLVGCSSTKSSSGKSAASGKLVAAPGFDPSAKTISVAALVPLTGPQANAGVASQGFQAYFDWRNATNPVGGQYKVNVNVQDTQYSNSVMFTDFNTVKGSVAMIGEVLGRTEALSPLLTANQMVAVATTNSTDLLDNANVIGNGVLVELQAASAMSYLSANDGAKGQPVCSLSQADDLGQPAVAAMAKVAPSLGLTVGTATTYVPGPSSDFSGQIQKLKSAGCKYVLFAGNPPAFIGSMVASAQLSFAPQWITTNTAVTAPGAYTAIASYLTANKVQFVGNGPAWDDTSVVGQKDMVAALKQYYPKTPASLTVASGWADAAFTAGILERALKNGDLSHAGVLSAANQAGSLTTDGVYDSAFVTGAPSARVPLKSVTIFNYSASTPSGMDPIEKNYLPSVTSTYQLG
jgi:ABC-type branched-subunit amino acid transport system substrate-binding protein